MNVLHLEVNDSGWWKRAMRFSRDDVALGDVLYDSEQLFRASSNPKLRLRIIAPGTTAPLMTWTRDRGWTDWPRREA